MSPLIRDLPCTQNPVSLPSSHPAFFIPEDLPLSLWHYVFLHWPLPSRLERPQWEQGWCPLVYASFSVLITRAWWAQCFAYAREHSIKWTTSQPCLKTVTIFMYLFIYCVFYGGQRTTSDSQWFSPLITYVPGINSTLPAVLMALVLSF